MEKIENLFWKSAENIPDQIKNNLDEKDKKYYQQYSNLINNYSKCINFSDMDLTKYYSPPQDLYVEIRALQDINGIETSEGKVNLVKNHTYSFKRKDIEHFLRIGMVVVNE